MVFSTEKQLKEYGDKIPEDKKTVLEQAKDKLKEAHANKDFAAIDTIMAELNTIWQEVSAELYKTTSGGKTPWEDFTANAQGDVQQDATDGEATETDFEEVK